MFGPILGFTIFFVISIIVYLVQQERRRRANIIKDYFAEKHSLEVLNVKSDTYSIGAKGGGVHFNTCDLYIVSDAWVIIGYTKTFSLPFFTVPVVLTNDLIKYKTLFPTAVVVRPKKINIRSFNNEVYIVFEHKSWMTTTIDFRLKTVSEEDKIKMERMPLQVADTRT